MRGNNICLRDFCEKQVWQNARASVPAAPAQAEDDDDFNDMQDDEVLDPHVLARLAARRKLRRNCQYSAVPVINGNGSEPVVVKKPRKGGLWNDVVSTDEDASSGPEFSDVSSDSSDGIRKVG